ncbi:hypothetical protein TNCV_1271281, partial [Trichonephila clavipes]
LVCSVFFFDRFSSGLHGNTAADSVRSEWPLWHAAKSKTQVFARRRIELKLKLELVEEKQKLLDIREREKENARAKVEDKQFKTLNKETATHIGIREAEDWFRPIDLAKEWIFQPGSGNEGKKNRFEQTSRTLQRKISMRSTKDQLVEKDVLMPVKHNVFLWNLPDVEEVPSHDGETV